MSRPGELRDSVGYLIAYNANGRGQLEGPWHDMYGNPIGHINEDGTWDTNFNRLSTQKAPGMLAQYAQRKPRTTPPGVGDHDTSPQQGTDIDLNQQNAQFDDPFERDPDDFFKGGQTGEADVESNF